MFYKIRNILYISALSLSIAVTLSPDVRAQGMISLSEDAVNDDANKDIPDEFAMFNDATETAPQGAPQIEQKETVVIEDDIFAPKKAEPAPTPAAAPIETYKTPNTPAMLNLTGAGIGVLGNDDPEINEDLFVQMSDLEKQTALLNLELRRERVKNEIEAIKNQRKQAEVQEQEKKETQEKQKVEWQKTQEQKVLQEQQKLRELDIEFEKLRQERLLNSYKNKYLEDNQKWIAHDADLYKQIEQAKKENQQVLDDSKDKFVQIKGTITTANAKAGEMVLRQKQKVDDLNAQISVLKARVIAQEKELENARKNPFEDVAENAKEEKELAPQVAAPVTLPELKLANMYAVMEIRGQGGELIAKLVNKDGAPFYVKKGTALQSGHIIEEITSTYVRADKADIKDYLYFAAGGILPVEQSASTLKGALGDAAEQEEAGRPDFVTSVGIPGVGSAMMVR